MTETTASVLLVDDHPLFRKGLSQLIELEPGLSVVGEASNGQDAIDMAKELRPNLIVLDLNMQGMDGLETTKILRAEGVESRIVILTVSDCGTDVITAITNGSDGYLLKDMEPEQIIEQINHAVNGNMAISDRLTEILAGALRQPSKKEENPLDSLTSRELEILKYIAQGKANKLIARELNISEGTVKVHVKHILKKLNFRSRIEAAIWVANKH